MNFIRRSILYIIRKKARSALIFLVMLVVSTLALTGITIKNASTSASNELKQNLGGGFKIEQISGGPKELTKEVADEFAEVDGITGYNAENIGPANLKNPEGKFLELEPIAGSMFANDEIFGKQANIYGYTDTEASEMFTGGSLVLEEGRQIVKEDSKKAMIHKELASKNNLKIGDKILVSMNDTITSGNTEAGALSEELEIVGIFDSTMEQQVSAFSTPGDLLENTVLMDIGSSMNLLSWASQVYYKVYYSVEDPAQLDSIMEKVSNLNVADKNSFEITLDNRTYNAVAGPLDNMNGVITTMLVVIVIISCAVLSLLLTMWTKSRIHESGILLSIGESRGKIIIQRVTEIALIAVLSLVVSYGITSVTSQQVSDMILENTVENDDDSSSYNEQSGAYTLAQIPTNTKGLAKIDVNVTTASFLWVVCMTVILILVSVFISSLQLYKLNPKELLTLKE